MRFRIKNHVIILVINVMRNHLLDNWILKVFGNVMFERRLIPTWCPINSMKKKTENENCHVIHVTWSRSFSFHFPVFLDYEHIHPSCQLDDISINDNVDIFSAIVDYSYSQPDLTWSKTDIRMFFLPVQLCEKMLCMHYSLLHDSWIQLLLWFQNKCKLRAILRDASGSGVCEISTKLVSMHWMDLRVDLRPLWK